ncbi:MAG: 50S ribosomal protein L18 [Alkalicoccus sp.]|jgi:large subunit ribosomal protein L18|uniref:Large ribosomal subunit protein uL18 n=1 Tax=Alkalicoccus saliphilus TaxID=200989 RepID=A0A2T4U4X3_9BACI|nr:50S ribosomal protein L18 [Alkalicoccus saliphilus]PTL38448.1 50S ribosomal protein L18 [Alkalicoccus saliphilus]TVP86587.1 MAG: 50S ribosomal protein L18 [Alkalicoccus sp.]
MITKNSKNEVRKKRHAHVRRSITGTAERPRLNVFRSNKHINAQLIDDVAGVTIAGASSLDKELGLENGGNKDAARQVGELVAKRALEQGKETVVFDRGGYLYHGRVKELADAAREAGLKF